MDIPHALMIDLDDILTNYTYGSAPTWRPVYVAFGGSQRWTPAFSTMR